ncbi:hypothetical protein [Reichenbachiella versicolor]|uniref:hypothetical protein n=1 Tax=Reichenbachiella versicolor TaxID=1821036 RepID=UPI000D6E8C89|nr:hypothetical protein [Reichenbachiella versicolor]
MIKVNYLVSIAVLLLSLSTIGCTNNEISIEDVSEFIPELAIPSETRLFSGDLNQDKIEDAILRFKKEGDPIEKEHILIILGKNDSTLKLDEEDEFSFDNTNGMVFNSITISENSGFTIGYKGKDSNAGSYRKITFRYHSDELGNDYWILNRDEELFQHDLFAPSPQDPIIATQDDMQGSGGEYFGNIKEGLYDAMLRMKIKDYIPDSTSECKAYSGDLNRDPFEDIILRFKMKNEPEYREHVYLFLGQENGKYILAAKNDSLEYDGVDGTVFDKIVIKNGYFSLEYYGYGNTSGSYDIITFKYAKGDENWILHKHGSLLTFRHFPEGDHKEMRTQKDFGKVLFKDFK